MRVLWEPFLQDFPTFKKGCESVRWTVLGYQSPYPGAGGATPGYLLESEDRRILIDCGSGVLSQLDRYCRPYELDAVVLSHLHHDHIADFFVLQYAVRLARQMGHRTRPLTVYAPAAPEKWARLLTYHDAIDWRPIEEHRETFVGSLHLSFHPTDHPIPCYAVLTDNGRSRILYGADAGPRTDWRRMVRSPDLFVCEATYLKRNAPSHPTGHLSAEQAAVAAEQIGAKRLLLTHLFPEYTSAEVEHEARPHFSGTLYVAGIGLSIRLG